MDDKIVHRDLSYKIVGLAIDIRKELGYGYLEKVYENAMMVMLNRNGIYAQQQVPLKVMFQGVVIGDYFPDIVVENQIILEIKSQDRIIDANKAQTLNYLKTTGLKLAIILNFGKTKLDYERLVY